MSDNLDRKIEIAVAAEVEKQLNRERAILKDAGGFALKIIAGSFVLLFAIFTVFGLTTWNDVKKETSVFVKNRADELIQKSDSETGVKQVLNDLVNRAIVSSVLLTLKRERDGEFELQKNEWDRLRAWVKIESLSVDEFTDSLSVFNSQKEERRKSDANSFLAEMLNPPDGSPYQWIKKQPEKRLAIMSAFEHSDMGAAAVEVARSPDASEETRIAAARYVRKVHYVEGFDKIVRMASSVEDGDLKKEALVTASVLRPTDARLLAETNKLVGRANPRSNTIRTAVEIVLEVWRSRYFYSESEPERIEAAKRLLGFAFDHGVNLSEEGNPAAPRMEAFKREQPRLVLWIPEGAGRSVGLDVSVKQLVELKPYWTLLNEAAALNDLPGIARLLIRSRRSMDTVLLTVRLQVPKDSGVVVEDEAGRRKTLTGGTLNDPLVLLERNKNLVLVWSDAAKQSFRENLVGFSGKGFEFSGRQTSRSAAE